MAWSCDRTWEVVLWGGVSMVLAVTMSALDVCSSPCWLLFLAGWVLSAGTALLLSSLKVCIAGRAVLVTGCDTGIGFALALHLCDQGFRVFAGCLNPDGEGARLLRAQGSSRIVVLRIDVTNQKQLEEAFQEVTQLLSHGEVLWGLVNNAGVSASGQIEWVLVDTYRRLMEINVLGVIATIKTFLPLIRQARGRVVNMSSVSGVMGRAMLSPYCITKYAVEGLSDCLRQEMKPWGVTVSIVEPGNFSAATQISTEEGVERQAEEMWASMGEEVRRSYRRDYFDHVMRVMQESASSGDSDLTPILTAVTEALTQRFPRARYRVVDTYYFFKIAAAIHLPESLYDLLYQWRHSGPGVPSHSS